MGVGDDEAVLVENDAAAAACNGNAARLIYIDAYHAGANGLGNLHRGEPAVRVLGKILDGKAGHLSGRGTPARGAAAAQCVKSLSRQKNGGGKPQAKQNSHQRRTVPAPAGRFPAGDARHRAGRLIYILGRPRRHGAAALPVNGAAVGRGGGARSAIGRIRRILHPGLLYIGRAGPAGLLRILRILALIHDSLSPCRASRQCAALRPRIFLFHASCGAVVTDP